MALLTPETQLRIERILQESLEGARVIASSVSVAMAGEVAVNEMILRLSSGETWATDVSQSEERLVLSRYVGPGGWSPTNPQRPADWVEVIADDLVEEDL
ncbi:MAG: hypothetical protein PHX88_11825 [Methanoculleus horonobensis]|jgi:hypothetical protein|nr:hypothetical protein [Methanoculleus horonobensis]